MKRKAVEVQDADGGSGDRAAEFAAHLRSLNKQFAAWVREQADAHGDELWTDGARAYARHAEQLTKEYADVLGTGGSGGAAANGSGAAPATKPFAGGGGSSSSGGGGGGGGAFGFAGATGGSSASAPAFAFGGAGGASSSSGGFAFGASAPAAGAGAGSSTPPASTGGFTFGGPAAFGGSGAPSSSGTPAFGGSSSGGGGSDATPPVFAFGAATQSTAGHTPAPAKFSFGGAAAGAGAGAGAGGFAFPQPGLPPAPGAGGGDAGGGADEDEGPKTYTPEITVDEDKFELLWSSKAKLAVLKKGGGPPIWDPRGVGMLTLRRFKQGGNTKPHVFFTTDAGRSLVVSPILESTNVVVPQGASGAKRASMSLLARDDELPPAGEQGGPPPEPKYSYQNCMFSFGTADKAADFAKKVRELKP